MNSNYTLSDAREVSGRENKDDCQRAVSCLRSSLFFFYRRPSPLYSNPSMKGYGYMTLDELQNQIDTDPDSIDWALLSRYSILTEEIIDNNLNRFKDYWGWLCQYQSFTENFLRAHEDDLFWDQVSRFQKLSQNFIHDYKDKVNWKLVCQYQTMTENFLENHKDFLHWDNVSKYQKFTHNFIADHVDELNWDYLSQYQVLDDSTIDTYTNKVNWSLVSKYQPMAESFIAVNADKIDWHTLDIERLSESFIAAYIPSKIPYREALARKHFSEPYLDTVINTVDTQTYDLNDTICKHQTLSEAFISNHMDYLWGIHNNKWVNSKMVVCNQKLSETFIDAHPDLFKECWKEIGIFQTLSQSFILAHKDQLDLQDLIITQECLDEAFLLGGDFLVDINLMVIFIPLQESTIESYADIINWNSVERYQVLSPNFLSKWNLKRPKVVNYRRDLKPMNLGQVFDDWYLGNWDENGNVSYNDLLQKAHDDHKIHLIKLIWLVYDMWNMCHERNMDDISTNDAHLNYLEYFLI